MISPNGIAPDPDKTSKVKHWPTPSSKVETQQLLGFANYYRRFVQGFASIAKPLHRLTEKKVAFHWTNECQTAFNHLKHSLITAPTLVMPNWSSLTLMRVTLELVQFSLKQTIRALSMS